LRRPGAALGDLAGLEALLAHDVAFTADGGGKVPALARTLSGRSRVARALINYWVRMTAGAPEVSIRPGARGLGVRTRVPVGVTAGGRCRVLWV
jgi:hypothetical protein